jgi:hypothetical protein
VKLRSTVSTVILALSITFAIGRASAEKDTVSAQAEKQGMNRRHSIGSSLFLLGNFLPGDPPYPVYYGQLNYGYQLTRKDFILVEAKTWTYYEPLGTYGSSKELYPGKVRAYGIGAGYQRFLWKNIFTTVNATPFLQQFYGTDNRRIQDGFQLYLVASLGYRFEFFKRRLFVDPAFAITCWPVNTNFPASFAEVESGQPKYKFEPRANFGFRF